MRASEAACPFCEVPLAQRPVRLQRIPRMSRAAAAAFGTALVVGCGSTVSVMGDGDPAPDATTTASSSAASSSSAGGFGGDGGDGGENALGGSLGLMYGASPMGGFATGGDDGDGGDEDGGHNTLYGSPIIQQGE